MCSQNENRSEQWYKPLNREEQRGRGVLGGGRGTAGVQATTWLYRKWPGVVHMAAVNTDEASLSWNLQSTVGRELIINNHNTTSGSEDSIQKNSSS